MTAIVATSTWSTLLDRPSNPNERDHVVQFYETQEFLYDAVSQFIGRGFKEGEGIIVIATAPHREGLEKRLEANGFDIETVRANGQLTLLDAADTLSSFMVDGMPDRDKFRNLIGSHIEKVARRYPKVRVYGEMVNLLWDDGNLPATIGLERLWNEMTETHSITLLCGYRMSNFNEELHDEAFRRICDVHSHVIPADDFPEPEDPKSQRRMIAVLQQQARALQAEIAERKKTEKSLQDALQHLMTERVRFEAVLRQMPAGVILFEAPSGKLILANRQVNEIFRDQIDTILNKSLLPEMAQAIKVFHENGRPYQMEEWPLARSMMKGEVVTAEEMDCLRGDGTRGALSVSSAPIRDAEGRIVAGVVTFHDITEHKQAQAEWVKESKLESIGLLAAGIAHDFNNILTAILGNISLAKLLIDSNPAAVEVLRQSEHASLRARDLTQQLLTFSKGGAPIKKPGAIADLLRDTATFALRGLKVRLILDIPENLRQGVYDVGQMSQVINGLLINAVQAMPNGGTITITARNSYLGAINAYQLRSGRYLQVEVRDEGIGIAPENLTRIFDPYFTTKNTGSGLGLATSYSIIKRHGGWIGVTSELHKGTTFTFFIPTSRDSAPCPISAAAIPKGQGRILMMDDEAAVRQVGSSLLKQLGYDVAVAVDGEEAIALYTESMGGNQPFDLVILDLTVPGAMGGKECFEKLRAQNPGVKAIVSSGYSTDPIMADFARHGFIGVVAKPYELSELSGAVYRILQNEPARSSKRE